MKAEKDLVWSFQLMQSPFCGGLIRRAKSGFKKDFERFLDISENNKDFSKWINELIEEGCLVEAGQEMVVNSRNGRTVTKYIVHFNKMLSRLRENPYYSKIAEFFDTRSVLGVSK